MRLPGRKESVKIKYILCIPLPIEFVFYFAQYTIMMYPMELFTVLDANEGEDFRKIFDDKHLEKLYMIFCLFIGAISTPIAVIKTLIEDVTHECCHHERRLQKNLEGTNQIDNSIRHQSTVAIISKTINDVYEYHFDLLRQCKSRDELNFERYSRSPQNSYLLSTLILIGILIGTFCILSQTYNLHFANEWIKDKDTMYIELNKQLLTAIAFVALTYPGFEVYNRLWQISEQPERLEQSSEGEIVGITPHS